ncbi:hypothetical protein FIBSPDRAFT_876627 [Athelia psychrophila]|uniref:Uncharacterized protein n=1 Tax=Athelia psychrophila TaxID=1759441 RepID=A0A167UUT7_9AGAM|nr:hypothetical protein FIBSPDRAFT_878634 [Fibularhizoctonia sp. CBS 109695]KZP06329.1 hypothetical protein FIBSPDRAFT_876627 [Fibularhizoctonia sp. CBS 109695]
MSSQSQTLCDKICRAKPRHGGFQFCGKKCASKATTLCGNCWTKPKFPPFEYCGKKCASSASAGNPGPNANAYMQPQVLPGVAGIQLMTPNPNPPNGNTYTKTLPQAPASQSQPPPLPIPPPAPPAGRRPPVPQGPPPANPAAAVLQSVKQAFSGGAPASPPPPPPPPPPGPPGSKNNGFVYIPPQSQLPQTKGGATLICLIPGCGKAVHLDANGLPASDYCSQRHREQAVNTGMVEPCIMCLSLPQGDVDHFCSRICREDALKKPFLTAA